MSQEWIKVCDERSLRNGDMLDFDFLGTKRFWFPKQTARYMLLTEYALTLTPTCLQE
jgi:hypothetical protein